jgi:hypothetical protein
MGLHRERPQRATLYAIGQSQSLSSQAGMPKSLPIGIQPNQFRSEHADFVPPKGTVALCLRGPDNLPNPQSKCPSISSDALEWTRGYQSEKDKYPKPPIRFGKH